MGSIDPAAPPFKIGSSKQEVIKALGTPPVLLKGGAMYSWSYGGVTVLFYDGKVHSVDGNTSKFEEGKAQ